MATADSTNGYFGKLESGHDQTHALAKPVPDGSRLRTGQGQCVVYSRPCMLVAHGSRLQFLSADRGLRQFVPQRAHRTRICRCRSLTSEDNKDHRIDVAGAALRLLRSVELRELGQSNAVCNRIADEHLWADFLHTHGRGRCRLVTSITVRGEVPILNRHSHSRPQPHRSPADSLL
jgi:hypothetical protein